MEPDPLALEAGLNMFAYAGNNPVMNTDSSGLDFKEISNLSATWLENQYNYVLAMPSIIATDYS